jgi:hypothetical protein
LKATAALVLTTTALALAGAEGCDKLGLGKKDADGGPAASAGGGGLFSFLDSSFEGDVTMSVTAKTGSKGGPKTVVFQLKSPKVRIDVGADGAADNPMLAQGGAAIIDPPAKKAYLLVLAQKKAIVLDFDKAKGGLKLPKMPGLPGAPSAPAGPPPDPPKVEKTGKKETIAGYQCELWKITSKTGRADACLAEGIKWIDLGDLGVQSPEFAAVAAVSDFNHFPLRVVSFDAQNVEQNRMEATKIEKKKLDDTIFTVPADFQVVDLAAMLGGLGGLPGGPPGGFPGGVPGPGGRFAPGTLPPGIPPPKRTR